MQSLQTLTSRCEELIRDENYQEIENLLTDATLGKWNDLSLYRRRCFTRRMLNYELSQQMGQEEFNRLYDMSRVI